MANTVIAVRSSSATGNQPSLGVIANGELSLNFADGILYYKTSSNTLGQIRTTQVSGSNQQVQFNDSGSFGSSSQFTFDKNTGLLSAPTLKSSQSSGDEGGQLDLATAATNSTLAGGSVSIDIYQNKLRFFEAGGTNRGAYIDLTTAGTGVGTNLLSGGGGSVTSVGGQTGAISNTQLVSFVTSSVATGNLIVYNGSNLTSIANVGTAGTYGNSTYVPVITTDAYGRITSVTNTAMTGTQLWSSNSQVYQATANGAQTSFSLGFSPNTSNNVLVTANGVVQYDYTVTGSTLTFNFTPANNTIIRVQSFGYIQSTIVSVPSFSSNGNLVVSSGSSLVALSNVGSAGSYGSASYIPVITTDAYGRISSVTNTQIAIDTSLITSGTLGFARGGTNATSYTTGTVLVSNGTAIVSLANTGTAGTYANAAYVPVITTDAYGRVSAVTNTAISIPTTAVTGTFGFSSGGTNASSYTTGALLTSNGTAIISLANTGTAGTYGNATYVPVITTDAYGRVTSVVNTAISGGGTNFNIYNVNSSIYRVTANGAQTSFDMGFSPVTSNNVIVTTNGIVQYDYSIAGSVITFNFTPANNTIVRAQVFGSNNAGVLAGSTPIVNNISFYNVNTQIYQATANGAQTSFNLGFTPTTSNNAVVTANGVVQYDYSITGSTLTFNFTPANNTLIRAQAFGVASPTNSATYNGDLTTIGNLTANTVTISNGILLNNTSIGLTQTVSTSYNGLSVGPMTLLSGVSVTVASGQRWYIL